MELYYQFKGQNHLFQARWTEEGHSAIFRNIRKELEGRHELTFSEIDLQIKYMDDLADDLYKQIHSLPQYTTNTYNPVLPKILKGIMSELTDCISKLPDEGQCGIFRSLCMDTAAIFQNTIDVFLEDNKYQGKMLKREQRTEKYMQRLICSSPQDRISLEFEDIVLQMTDLANVLDCLTKAQKRRLVQHVIMGYTISKIAELDDASKQSVHESIKSALTKLKENLE